MLKGIIFTLSAISLLQLTRALDRLQYEKQTLDKVLSPDRYDVTIRPHSGNGSEGAVEVETNMYVRSISDIDDVKMEYNVQLTFRQKWKDDRLAYDDMGGQLRYLTVSNPHKIWIPDTFFSNEREGHFHNIITPNVLVRIYPNGDILYSVRVSLVLSCPMDLRHYPMDKQVCEIILASYAYTTEDIIFKWKPTDPVQMSKKIHLPQFHLNSFLTDYCTSKTSTGEYTCVKLIFHLSREVNSFLVRVYIPQMMLVLLSWLPFWLDYRSTMSRLAIWLTVLLTMTVMAISIQATVPAVAYTKAIDVWSGTCFTFLCAVVIELVLVMKCVHEEDQVRKANLAADEELCEKPVMGIDDAGDRNDRSGAQMGRVKRWLGRYRSRGQKIDVVSRICFPLVFALFNLFYWSSYMTRD